MKRVSFKVAKTLKESGYPQIFIDYAYYEDNKLHGTEDPYNNCHTIIAYAPTYLEVWLWLWQEKCIKIDVTTYFDSVKGYKSLATILCYKNTYSIERDTPEEAIIAAIEYLVDNDLIKE